MAAQIIKILLLFHLYSNVFSQIPETVEITIPELGRIQGIQVTTWDGGNNYWTFHGIPYAETESYMGENRFEPSRIKTTPLTDDDSLFHANKTMIICPQNNIITSSNEDEGFFSNMTAAFQKTYEAKRQIKQTIKAAKAKGIKLGKNSILATGQEDCLTISISTPRVPSETEDRYPVIFFIHGGGSDSMWGNLFSGLRLLDQNIILVSINYRLGTLGALNLGIDSAPGNAAMYDCIEGLKWVNNYIQYFGGDPNNVMIMGQSAGSMMVSHLLLSPLAKGLFHKAWGFSGSALTVWGTAENPSLGHHLDVAHYAGCWDREVTPIEEAPLEEIAECMKRSPMELLVLAMSQYVDQEESAGRLGYDARVPSIQNPNLNHEIFLAKNPMDILKNWEGSPVPLVLGANKHDGSSPLLDLYRDYFVPNDLVNNATFVRNELVPSIMKTMRVIDDTGELYHSFAYSYLGDAVNTDDFDSKIPGLIDMSTVFGFKGGSYKMVEYQAKVNPNSYFFSFDYYGKFTIYNLVNGFNAEIPGGIAHADDLNYVFYFLPLLNEDIKVARKMVKYITNFAYFGNPNGDVDEADEFWPRFNADLHPCLSINRHDEVFYDCYDSWIGNALELVAPSDPTDPTDPTEDPTFPTETAETTDGVTEPTTPSGSEEPPGTTPIQTTESGPTTTPQDGSTESESTNPPGSEPTSIQTTESGPTTTPQDGSESTNPPRSEPTSIQTTESGPTTTPQDGSTEATNPPGTQESTIQTTQSPTTEATTQENPPTTDSAQRGIKTLTFNIICTFVTLTYLLFN